MSPALAAGLVGIALVLAASARAEDQPWVAPQEDRIRPNPVNASRDAVRRGQALFKKHCATCHGPEGRGDGPAAAFGLVTPRDLTAPAVQSRLSDGEIYWKLSKGRKAGNEVVMPPGEDKIRSAEDRWKVVLFVRSLVKPASSPTAP